MSYDAEMEKKETIDAGYRALNRLRMAQNNLNSARNWGLCDMFGGGLFIMIKQSKMEAAKENMKQANYDLRDFSQKLKGVSMYYNLDIKTDDYISFADGFMANWMVLDRINTARNQVKMAIYRIEKVLKELNE